MTRNLLRAGALSCALMTSTAMCTQPALAQQASVYQHVDGNGVDMVDGSFNFSIVEGVIGAGKAALSLVRTFGAGGEQDNLSVRFSRAVSGGQANISITIGNRREDFTGASGATNFTSRQAEGATLTKIDASQYVYRDAAGTVTTFAPPPGLSNAANNGYCATGSETYCGLIATSTVAPDGGTLSYQWDVGENCFQSGNDQNGEPIFQCAQFYRLRGIANSYGYSVGFNFATEANPTSGLPGSDWHRRIGATFANSAVSGSPTRTVSYATPSTGVTEITTDGGHVWRLTRDSQMRLSGIRRPGSTTDDVTIGYAGPTSLVVNAVTRDGIATSYSRSVAGSTGTMTATDAASEVTTVTSNLSLGRPTAVTDPLNRTTEFQYDSNARLTRTTFPEDNYVQLTLDARGNTTQMDHVSKSGATTLTTSASYDSNCSNVVTCNRPNSVTDARGNTTDFTYDATHGGVLTVTAPAPSGSGDRPQVRYAYTQTNGEYQLTSASACATGTAPTCVGTAGESRVVLAYDANGNVTSRQHRDGTGALSATSTMTHTSAGDVATIDGPLSGTADTVHMRYNQARRMVGAISPDPDGGGSLTRRATRTTYDDDTGLPIEVEQGNVAGTSDTDWAGFTASQGQEIEYDGHQRPVVQRLTSGSTTYALTQTSYDNLGRADCVAQRMNPAQFATSSLPSDACTLDTEGSFGPDRIVKTTFDDAGQIVLVQSAFGVSGVEANEVTTAYTANGRVEHVTDGEGNRTTYEYDGHDRLVRTRMPSTSTDGVSSTTDDEILTLDANGNVTNRELRDGTSIAFTYDALNRPTAKNLPGSEPDVTYSYDLLGRLTSASQSGHALSFTFDALGRNLTQVGPNGTTASEFDLAGRRTRLTWPGTAVTPSGQPLYVDYDYLVTGEMAVVRERGATSGAGVLATYSYDNQGRRTGITRGNGTTSTYSYDPVSRLASLGHDLASTANDLTLGFSHNPASQIVANTRSNDNYRYNALANGSVTDTHNGLNQILVNGAASVTHDARGNLTGDGAATFSYDSQNQLTGAVAAGITSSYVFDPLGRLARIDASNSAFNSTLDLDGLMVIGEREPTGTRTRTLYAYVPGPDASPVALYSHYGASLSSVIRYWYHEDERGSPVAISREDGTLLTLNRYDEYGRPGASNWGRFQYTGQWYLGVPAIYHYRARTYHPGLGRFMQTDPIGYRDGMNLYGYVRGDPVNLVDPLGLEEGEIVVKGKRDEDFECSSSYEIQVGGVCMGSADLSSLIVGATTFTITLNYDNADVGNAPCRISGRTLTCSTQAEEPEVSDEMCIADSHGPVLFDGGGLDLVLGPGGGFGVYEFSIPTTGARGWVATGSFLGGAGGGLAGGAGAVNSWGNFVGRGWRFEFETPLAGAGGTLIFNGDRELSGVGGTYGVSSGAYGGATITRVLWSNRPVC